MKSMLTVYMCLGPLLDRSYPLVSGLRVTFMIVLSPLFIHLMKTSLDSSVTQMNVGNEVTCKQSIYIRKQ